MWRKKRECCLSLLQIPPSPRCSAAFPSGCRAGSAGKGWVIPHLGGFPPLQNVPILPRPEKKKFGEPALEPGKFLPWSLGGGERLMGGGPRHPPGMGTVLLPWEEALEHLCKPSVPQTRANFPKNPHSPQAGGKERWAGIGSSLFLRALQQMLLLRRKWGQNVDLSNFLHLPLPCQQPWNSRKWRWLGTGSL